MVDGSPITEEEFLYLWERNSPGPDTPEARQRLLDEMIERRLMLLSARDAGLEEDPEVRHQYEGILIGRFKEQHLNRAIGEIDVGEDELRSYYESQSSAKYARPERLRLAVLWLDSQGQPDRAERHRNRLKEATTLFENDKSLKADPSRGFGQLAIAYSSHQPTRFKGGIQRSSEPKLEIDPWWRTVATAAAALEHSGDISPVIVDENGVFLVRLIERHPERRLSFEEARSAIRSEFITRKRASLREKFDSAIKEGRTIKHFNDHLRDVEMASEPAMRPPTTTKTTPSMPPMPPSTKLSPTRSTRTYSSGWSLP